MSKTHQTPRRRRRLAVAALTITFTAWAGFAGAQDPYGDDPPPPAPKAPAPKAPAPKAPAPKAPAPKAPAPKAPAPKAPAPKAAPKPAPAPAAPVPPPAEPKAKAPKKDAAKPDATGKLPSWHPPVQPPSKDPAARKAQRERLEQMMKMRAKAARDRQKEVTGGAAAADEPKKKKYPVDAHGYCIGDGPQDRPKDINLFHGWFQVNNDKAKAPPPKAGGEDWWGKQYFGNKDWWVWRLTPYPYRYENHDDHCDPRNQPIPLLANIINIGALLFLMMRFGKKPVETALRDRKKNVMSEIDKAQAIKKSAEERLDQYEHELDNLDEKLQTLRDTYAAEGDREEQRAREDAAEARDRMLADAEFRIQQEGKTARDSLSREALEEALAAAEKLLTTTVSAADHDRLAEEYLEQIGPALKAQQEDA